jgi:hypothetical protein
LHEIGRPVRRAALAWELDRLDRRLRAGLLILLLLILVGRRLARLLIRLLCVG